MNSLTLPKNGKNTSIENSQSILFIGANGSGKTRLGAWIEIDSPQKNLVHRISAQKSLMLPDSITPQSIEQAKKNLLFGSPAWSVNEKKSKWNQKPATEMLNDYQKLMVYLFSDETEENAKFKRSCKLSENRIEPPITKLDQAKELWENILPHRELVIGGLRLQTCIKERPDHIYNSSEMSDGERVIFYLIGQCLAAPQNGIIVIDEPELHLHKSIQVPLWDKIEKLRDDCLFVYLTHDVDFVAAKGASQKIWLKSFDGSQWDWEIIDKDENLPEELLVEILGSRKPIVFVEGENNSYDVSLYRSLLPSFLIIPRGSCTQVIQTVKALKANKQMHHLDVYGLIDRDRRNETEINNLEENSIYVLKVAEVENLFCTKEILEIVSERLGRNPEEDFNIISNFIFKKLQKELDGQISLQVSNEVKYQLNNFDVNQKGEHNINEALNNLVSEIKVDEIYSETRDLFTTIINNKDYEKLLSIYNRKSLSSQISEALGLAKKSLPETIVRLAKGESNIDIKMGLKPYFGKFQKFIK
ncbi:MAG: DUF4435 domain-containing protein [Spirochaetia bacterium]|nr:DUF4435 domain-containing protein [Spirochaetia bacterium]